jgi:hypothetical protein
MRTFLLECHAKRKTTDDNKMPWTFRSVIAQAGLCFAKPSHPSAASLAEAFQSAMTFHHPPFWVNMLYMWAFLAIPSGAAAWLAAVLKHQFHLSILMTQMALVLLAIGFGAVWILSFFFDTCRKESILGPIESRSEPFTGRPAQTLGAACRGW